MYIVFSFWLSHAAFRILVLQAEIEPGLPEVEAQSPNHWATRDVPFIYVLGVFYVSCISLVKTNKQTNKQTLLWCGTAQFSQIHIQ